MASDIPAPTPAPTMEQAQPSLEIAVLLFEGMTASDAITPYEVLRWLPGAVVKFVAETPGPKRMDSGFLTLTADYALEDVPHPDVLVVPPPPLGSPSYANERLLAWLRAAHETTQWTVSLCAGPLLLGAAGLLNGVRATANIFIVNQLAQFGAIPAYGEQYVRDGKIVTASDYPAGIAMALRLTALIAGEETARAMQLLANYDPHTPYDYAALRADPATMARAQVLLDGFFAAAAARRAAPV